LEQCLAHCNNPINVTASQGHESISEFRKGHFGGEWLQLLRQWMGSRCPKSPPKPCSFPKKRKVVLTGNHKHLEFLIKISVLRQSLIFKRFVVFYPKHCLSNKIELVQHLMKSLVKHKSLRGHDRKKKLQLLHSSGFCGLE
jgi:hypothetical protein